MDLIRNKKLSPLEKSIYLYVEYLKQQKEIYTICIPDLSYNLGVHRSQISRALRSLEEKNLINIVRIGRFRKVVIQS